MGALGALERPSVILNDRWYKWYARPAERHQIERQAAEHDQSGADAENRHGKWLKDHDGRDDAKADDAELQAHGQFRGHASSAARLAHRTALSPSPTFGYSLKINWLGCSSAPAGSLAARSAI